jgi:hypothetical protein
MPPAIIAIAAGGAAAFFGASLVLAGAIGIGAAVAVKYLGDALTPDFDMGAVNPAADQEITTSANQPRKIIYGEAVAGGQIIGYANPKIGDKKYHIMAIHLAGHPCESVEIYEIEGLSGAELASVLTAQYHLGTQTTANSLAFTYIDGWTAQHIGFGLCNAYLKIEENADKFPNGVTDIKFKIKGKKLYDPRLDTTMGGSGSHRLNDTTTWQWSDNSILCSYDWAMNHGYRPLPERRIPFDFVALTANYCDELATYTDSSGNPQTEKRFTCNGVLNNALRPGDGLKYLLSTMGANIYRPNGRLYIKPAMYAGPANVTLSPADFVDQPTYQPHRPERERCNLVRGEYVAPELKYQQTDCPVIENQTLQGPTKDGAILEANLQLLMTNSSTMAQRLCNLYLQRNRAGFIGEVALRGVRLDVVPGSVVQFDDAATGISREFIVQNYRFDIAAQQTLIALEEESPDIYPDDFTAVEVALPANTSLPDTTTVDAVTTVVFTQTANTSWRTGYLTWAHPVPSSVVKYEIVITSLDELTVFTPTHFSNSEYVDLSGLGITDYKAHIRAINRFGKYSPTTVLTFVVDDVFAFTGSKWLSGTDLPASGIGNIDDYYWQTTTADVYQKIDATTWVLAGNLAGGDGDVWESGEGEPAGGLGEDGDWYINTLNSDVYRKAAGTWVLQLNINGQNGLSAYEIWLNNGGSGTETDFLNYLNGSDGVDGNTWFSVSAGAPASGLGVINDFALSTGRYVYRKTGSSTWTYQYDLKGVSGTNGSDGLSAYQIWLNNGNSGTEAAFLAALNGSDGVDGNTWFSVSSGAPSSGLGVVNDFALSTGRYVYRKTGVSTWAYQYDLKGVSGTNGSNGLSAYQIWLNNGNSGTEAAFLNDLNGNDGVDGNTWYNIDSGSLTTSFGKTGDFDLSLGRYVYKKVNATTWQYQYDLKGPQGDQGIQGPIGPPGAEGPIATARSYSDSGSLSVFSSANTWLTLATVAVPAGTWKFDMEITASANTAVSCQLYSRWTRNGVELTGASDSSFGKAPSVNSSYHSVSTIAAYTYALQVKISNFSVGDTSSASGYLTVVEQL